MGKAMFNKNAKFDFLNSLIWKHFIGVPQLLRLLANVFVLPNLVKHHINTVFFQCLE
jgi:hypothetical protein